MVCVFFIFPIRLHALKLSFRLLQATFGSSVPATVETRLFTSINSGRLVAVVLVQGLLRAVLLSRCHKWVYTQTRQWVMTGGILRHYKHFFI